MQLQEIIIKKYIKDIAVKANDSDDSDSLIINELSAKILQSFASNKNLKDILYLELGRYINDLWIEPVLGKQEVIEDINLKDLFIWYKICKKSHFFSNNNSSLKFYLAYVILKDIRNKKSKFIDYNGFVDINDFVHKEVLRWSSLLFYINSERNTGNPIMSQLMSVGISLQLRDQIVIDDIEDWFRMPEFVKLYSLDKGKLMIDEYIAIQEMKIGFLSVIDKIDTYKNITLSHKKLIQLMNVLIEIKKIIAEKDFKQLSKIDADKVVNMLISKGIIRKYFYEILQNSHDRQHLKLVVLRSVFEFIQNIKDLNAVQCVSKKIKLDLLQYDVFDPDRKIQKTFHDMVGGKKGWIGILSIFDNYKNIFGFILIISLISFNIVGALLSLNALIYTSILSISFVLTYIGAYLLSPVILKKIRNKNKTRLISMTAKDMLYPENIANVKKPQYNIFKNRANVMLLVITITKIIVNVAVLKWISIPFLIYLAETSFVITLLAAFPIILMLIVDIFWIFYFYESIVGYVLAKTKRVSSVVKWDDLKKIINFNGKKMNILNVAKEQFKIYLLPDVNTGEDGLKKSLSDYEKEVAWIKHWNLVIKQLYEDDKISYDEFIRLSYDIEEDIYNYLNIIKIKKEPDISKPVKNGEAKERLLHYVSTLLMNLEYTPSWEKMKVFSVMIPCNDEVVIYPWAAKDIDDFEGLFTLNRSGFVLLNEQISIYSDEWKNFVIRLDKKIGLSKYYKKSMLSLLNPENKSLSLEKIITDEEIRLEIRLWLSYRYQPLVRTVRGIMNYERTYEFYAKVSFPTYGSANIIQASESEKEYHEFIRKKILEKFECIVGHQPFYVFANSKDEEKINDNQISDKEIKNIAQLSMVKHQKSLDMITLLNIFGNSKALKLSFISDGFAGLATKDTFFIETDNKIAVDDNRRYVIKINDAKIKRITLETDKSFFAQGKAVNHNSLVKFIKGQVVQSIDMNQDMDFEETFKSVGLISKFDADENLTVIGLSERVFTAKSSKVGKVHAFTSEVFDYMIRRVASFFKLEMFYGHTDFINVADIRNIGLIMPTYITDDIPFAYKAMAYGKTILHNETMRGVKGREGGYYPLLGINEKFIVGAYQRMMTRYLYRFNNNNYVFNFSQRVMYFLFELGYYLKKSFNPAVLLVNSIVVIFIGINLYSAFPSLFTFGIIAMFLSQSIAIPGLVHIVLRKGIIKGLSYIFSIAPWLFIICASMLLNVFSSKTIMKALKGFGSYVRTGRTFSRATLPLLDTNNINNISVYSLSKNSISLAIILAIIAIASILLVEDFEIIFSVLFMIVPFSSLIASMVVNPIFTPAKVKIKNWKEKNRADNKLIKMLLLNKSMFVTIILTVGIIVNMIIYSNILWIFFVGWLGIYFMNKIYRDNFNILFWIFVVKTSMIISSTFMFWISMVAYKFKTKILSKKLDYSFGLGLTRHNDAVPTISIAIAGVLLLGMIIYLLFGFYVYGFIGYAVFSIIYLLSNVYANLKLHRNQKYDKTVFNLETVRRILCAS